MQKVTALILLFAFLCNGAGFYSVFQFQQRKTDKSIKLDHYRRQDLLTVSIPVNSSLENQGFKRIEQKEFNYRGHRYDEIRREKKADHVIVYLSHDSYEEELISFLQSFFNSGTHSNQQKRAALNFKSGMIKSFYASPVNAFCNTLTEGDKLPLKNKIDLSAPYIEVAIPPPRQA